jgi:crotonobetainyl-CoA:carnitine CoA-transferase CaiB-like acyl-CoA transferase
MRALNGLLVLDLTRLLPGAVATQTLAAHGARVIKIEQPGVGDYARHSFTATTQALQSRDRKGADTEPGPSTQNPDRKGAETEPGPSGEGIAGTETEPGPGPSTRSPDRGDAETELGPSGAGIARTETEPGPGPSTRSPDREEAETETRPSGAGIAGTETEPGPGPSTRSPDRGEAETETGPSGAGIAGTETEPGPGPSTRSPGREGTEREFQNAQANPIFAATNRGKESIELDLKDEDGRNALRVLAMEADVLIEGFRPGVMHRLGIDYEHLRTLNPRLIYVALTGYGQRGEYSQMAGHDINYLALSGVLAEIGTTETPVIPGVQLADLAGGSMQVVIGTLLALQARERTGEGQFVDVSMTDGVASLLPIPLSAYAATRSLPPRGDSLLTGRYACYGIYPAAEGFVAVGALEPKFWQTLCEALGEPSWIPDQFADEPRRSELKRLLAARLREKSAEDWFAELRNKDCCVTPVRDLTSARPGQDPTPRLSATPAAYAESVPKLGEHTEVVLKEFGFR